VASSISQLTRFRVVFSGLPVLVEFQESGATPSSNRIGCAPWRATRSQKLLLLLRLLRQRTGTFAPRLSNRLSCAAIPR
jgi:hypothetical protein